MNKFMKKLWEKKNSKKGFTLVELIVVLVILAILAAIMIPSMIGWIDKAKEKQIVLEARNAELAAQTVLYERYAASTGSLTAVSDTAITGDDLTAVKSITGDLPSGVTLKWTYDTKAKITAFEYIVSGGKTATYNGTNWTVKPTPASTP